MLEAVPYQVHTILTDDVLATVSIRSTGPPISDTLLHVRRRMIWNRRPDFGAEVIGSSDSGYAA